MRSVELCDSKEKTHMNYQPNACVCGARDSNLAFPVADWNFACTTEIGLMMRCLGCGSLYPDRFPDADTIALAYRSYYTMSERRTAASRFRRLLLETLQGELTNRHLPNNARRVLDFGCGSGGWLARMKKSRPELALAGTDITKPGLSAPSFRWVGPSDLPAERNSFDWITLSHVIEHVFDPRQTLLSLSGCLAPGGAIWIATPNAKSFLFSRLEGRARDADFPRHRQVFSRQGLVELLYDCGFEAEFKIPPRINAVLNLASSLAARSRPPLDVGPRVEAAHAVKDTLSHIFAPEDFRWEDSPEHIVIARLRDERRSSGASSI